MVLTLQSVIEGIDPALEEAALGMGARPLRAFARSGYQGRLRPGRALRRYRERQRERGLAGQRAAVSVLVLVLDRHPLLQAHDTAVALKRDVVDERSHNRNAVAAHGVGLTALAAGIRIEARTIVLDLDDDVITFAPTAYADVGPITVAVLDGVGQRLADLEDLFS